MQPWLASRGAFHRKNCYRADGGLVGKNEDGHIEI